MADSGLSFDHPGPSNGVVPIFNTKSHFFKQIVPLSHIMRLTPMGAAWANIAIGTHKQYTSHKSGIKSVSHESSMVRQYTDAYQSHSTP